MDVKELLSFASKSAKEREAEALKSMWRVAAKCADEIARARRTAEISHGISNEEFDEKLNEFCVKSHEKYRDMDQKMMALDMLKTLLMETDPEDIEIDVLKEGE